MAFDGYDNEADRELGQRFNIPPLELNRRRLEGAQEAAMQQARLQRALENEADLRAANPEAAAEIDERNRLLQEQAAALREVKTNTIVAWNNRTPEQKAADEAEAQRLGITITDLQKMRVKEALDAFRASIGAEVSGFVNTPKKSGSPSTDTTCGICLLDLSETPEGYTSEEAKAVVLRTEGGTDANPVKCGHKFHRRCIEAWFRTQGDFSSPGGTRRITCPLDRKIVKAYYPLSTEGGRRRKTRKTRKTRGTRKVRKTRKSRNIRKTRK